MSATRTPLSFSGARRRRLDERSRRERKTLAEVVRGDPACPLTERSPVERTMYEWVSEAVEALGLPPELRWVDDQGVARDVLDLAREVSQGVARPAAPLGAFLAGLAVARDPEGGRAALERVRAQLAPTLRPDEQQG
jgi:hypothetical protein